MPKIISSQEAEIRRITVGSHPGQIVYKTLSQKTLPKKGWWSGSRCRPWVQALFLQKKNKKGFSRYHSVTDF
jgi:hypothetical protein